MRERVWDNPEIRRLTAGIAVVMAVFTLVLLAYWHFTVIRIQNTLHARSLAIIGRLAEQHPEWKDDAAAAFAKTPTAGELEAGRGAAAGYGFDKSLPLRLDTDLRKLDSAGLGTMVFIGAATFALLVLCAFRVFGRMYRTVEGYASLAERIVEGEFRTKAFQPEEGVFSKLAHQFNQMSNRLERTLERLQDEKSSIKELLSDISHQLKTPLASLKMFNELLQDGADHDVNVRIDFLNKSAAQIEKMEWLIRQLLTVARVEAGATQLRRESKTLLSTLETAVDALAPQWQAKSICVTISTTAAATTCFAHDPEWLGEAFANIIKNSIEHTPYGGRIGIVMDETAVFSRITVRDNGTGIAKDELPHIFKRFYQGRNKTPTHGTGIGLSLAKAIVEQHGGFIHVSSAPDQGTIMKLTFPKNVGPGG